MYFLLLFSYFAAGGIAFPVSIIFNLSLQTGDIPDIWKLASVVPVFKKGYPSDPCNYRPITLTCIVFSLSVLVLLISQFVVLLAAFHKVVSSVLYFFLFCS